MNTMTTTTTQKVWFSMQRKRLSGQRSRPVLTITRPGDLISEIPGIIQFTPEAPSLVILGTIRGGVDGTPVMRIDIPVEDFFAAHIGMRNRGATEPADIDSHAERAYVESRLACEPRSLPSVFDDRAESAGEFCAHVATLLTSQDLDRASVVVLLPESCTPDSLGWDVADSFVEYLDIAAGLADTELTIVLHAEEIAAGAPWRPRRSEGLELGVQEDPRAGKLAMEAVVEGNRIYETRGDIERAYTRTEDEGDIAAVPLQSAFGFGFSLADLDKHAGRLRAIARQPKPFGTRELEEAGALLGSADICSHVLMEIVAGRIAVEFGEKSGGDGGKRDFLGAEPRDLDVLMEISRRGSDHARGGALLINGTSHYLRGSGIHAVVCFEAAQRTGFMPHFNRLILALITRGTAPEKVCVILAELLDIDDQIPA